MSVIVLDIELADKNIFKEMAVFIDGKFPGYSFRPPKKVPTHKTSVLGAQETYRELC